MSRAQAVFAEVRRLALLTGTAIANAFRWAAPRFWFRALVALLCLAFHLTLFAHEAKTRFGVPFNSDPKHPPVFANPDQPQGEPATWPRLAVSRWDTGHYTRLALRGYKLCPQRDLRGDKLGPALDACDLSFFPTYSFLGGALSLRGRIPVDYVMLGISLLASFGFLVMFTGRTMLARLGLANTYLALLAFNLFSTGFTLVTVQTEPCVLFLGLASFILFANGHRVTGALAAGAATAFRINAVAAGAAYAVAILAYAIVERRRSIKFWLSTAAALVLSGWGMIALFGFYWIRFKDPLLYVHAHSSAFGHSASGAGLTWDSIVTWMMRSLDRPLHEGVWIILTLLAMAIGSRGALRQSPSPERAYWYAFFFVNFGLTAWGSMGLSFAGMNRYALLSLPIFFAVGFIGKKHPFAFMLWLAFSFWHYTEVDMCHYLGHINRTETLKKCHSTQIP